MAAITTKGAHARFRFKPLSLIWSRRYPQALAVLTLPLMLQPAQAADWVFKPAIEVRESFSDNVRLQPHGQEQSDFVTEIIPRFTLTGTGRRLKLQADYSADALFYSRDSGRNDLLHDIHADVQAELIDGLLFVDGKAMVSQQNINAFGPQVTDNINASANRAEVRTVSVSPYLRHRFSNVATGEIRYAHEAFESSNDELASTKTDRFSVVLSSGPSFQTLGWGLLYSDQKTKYANSGTVGITTYFGNLRYKLSPTFALTATGGHEQYGYLSLRDRSEGALWTVGFAWQPTPRTSIEASAGRRFFGETYSVAATHRARHSVWALGYNEDIKTTQSQFQIESSINTANFLNRLWTTSIPDPETRRAAVEGFIRDTGLPSSVSSAINSFSNRFFLQKSLQASVALNGARNTVVLSAYDVRRTAQSGLNIDIVLFGASGLIGDSEDMRQRGLNGLWNWRITPHTNANFSVGMNKVSSTTSSREDRSKTVRLALTHQFSRKLKGSVEVRRLQQDSTVASSDIRENAIAASLSAEF